MVLSAPLLEGKKKKVGERGIRCIKERNAKQTFETTYFDHSWVKYTFKITTSEVDVVTQRYNNRCISSNREALQINQQNISRSRLLLGKYKW